MNMKYILFRVYKKYKYHKKLNALLIIELAISFSLIALSINYGIYTVQEHATEELRQRDKEISLVISQFDSNIPAFIPTEADIIAMQEMSNTSLEIIIARWIIEDTPNGLFDYFCLYSSRGINGEYYFAGSKVEQWIEDRQISLSGVFHELPENYEITLPGDDVGTVDNTGKYVILPIDQYYSSIDSNGLEPITIVRLSRLGASPIMLEHLLNYLEKEYGNQYSFSFSNEEYSRNKTVEYLSMIPGYFGKVAIILLANTIIGFAGIEHLIFLKRKKNYGISLACGIPKPSIIVESIFEQMGICLIGAVLGIIVGSILTSKLDFGLAVVPTVKTAIIVILLAILMSVILSFSSIIAIKRSNIRDLIADQ